MGPALSSQDALAQIPSVLVTKTLVSQPARAAALAASPYVVALPSATATKSLKKGFQADDYYPPC